MKDIVIKKSKVQGTGVFANRDFSEGAVVLVIDDSHIVEDESKLTKYQLEFVADYLPNKIVLMQSPERYINHSCDPSTYVKTVNGVRRVLAMRDIQKGEEITYDYAMNSFNEGTFECYCGSENCRGVYQGNFFKLPLDVQLKYLSYLEDWFIEENSKRVESLRSKCSKE